MLMKGEERNYGASPMLQQSQVSSTIPLIIVWSLALAVPYGRECYQVSGSDLGVKGGGAACVVGGVCLGEIRKKKQKTDTPVDGSLSVFFKISPRQCVFRVPLAFSRVLTCKINHCE